MQNLEIFSGLYQLSKTLRFELIPSEETVKNIERHGIIEQDSLLAEGYKDMKRTLDAYHKDFIKVHLCDIDFGSSLEEFAVLYAAYRENGKDSSAYKSFKKCKEALRKKIVAAFKSDKDSFDALFSGDLIKNELQDWLKDHNDSGDLAFREEFKNYTTYFSGYNENRKNMYSAEEKSTAIAYRLIDENLPKFIDNIAIFQKVAESPVAENFPILCKELESVINYSSLADIFTLSAYSDFLTQSQIDAYNTIIGGIKENDVKKQGLNEYINLFNQKHPKEKLPQLKPLYKQILSDRVATSWLPEAYENAPQMLDGVNLFYSKNISPNAEGSLPVALQKILATFKEGDLSKIFVRNDLSITTISQSVFGSFAVLKDGLVYYYENVIDPQHLAKLQKAKTEKAAEKLNDEEKKFISGPDYFSLSFLQEVADAYIPTLDAATYPQVFSAYSPSCIADYFNADKVGELAATVQKAYAKAETLLNVKKSEDYSLSQGDKDKLKALLDSVLNLLHYVKPLYLKADSVLEKDDVFYGEFSPLYEKLQEATKLYDKVRNFVTKKPYSTEKIKLNFDYKGNFLNGWVDSKTENSDNGTQYGGYLFRKANSLGEYDYYLGVSSNTKLFRSFVAVEDNDASEYERLDYYQPKTQTIYGSAYCGEKTYAEDKAELCAAIRNVVINHGTKEIIAAVEDYLANDSATPKGCLNLIRNADSKAYEAVLSDKVFDRKNKEVITNLKNTLAVLTRIPGADISSKKDYTLFTEIIEEIESLAVNKVIRYFTVSKKELDTALKSETKPLYLFKISNKDLSYADAAAAGLRKSRGKENLHTMYFRALMEGGNGVYDLGRATVFYRKKSLDLEKTTIHPANQPLKSKTPGQENHESVFSYDLVKNRRFTVDKFQLHFSIVQNYQAPDVKSNYAIEHNEKVVKYLQNNPDVNIIGIDRGERHLLYISMVNRQGRVVFDKQGKPIQYSLNCITGEYKDNNGKPVQFVTPYRNILDKREKEREEARESWGTVEQIKDLKTGYLSQVVHHIAKLMVEYNAIVVLEDLNSGFKNSRKCVETQVYQNFEKALIDKLNYLVFKDVPSNEPGGLYHALQLTSKFESFKKLDKQSGFLFYVPAWNTSKIDPVTGFVDFLKPKYQNIADAKKFFGKFDAIRFNPEKDYFEFSFDYANFTEKAAETRTEWTVCTYGDTRYSFNRFLNNNKGGYETHDVTAELKELFRKEGIAFEEGGNLVAAIAAKDSAGFFSALMAKLRMVLAMRYSNPELGKDFILSPVADANGEFFCTETARPGLPTDADANGAFNIARKGLWVLERIDEAESYKDWTTKISNRDWLKFVQKRFC